MTLNEMKLALFVECVFSTHDRGPVRCRGRFKNFLSLIENIVATDGVERRRQPFQTPLLTIYNTLQAAEDCLRVRRKSCKTEISQVKTTGDFWGVWWADSE